MNQCKICSNVLNNKQFTALEMMRGTRAKFEFIECGACGTVQLLDSGADMSSYYDNSSYGSFQASRRSQLKAMLRRARNGYAVLGTHSLLGPILNRINPVPPDYSIIGEYASLGSRILDVGCGTGTYIRDLADIGFSDVSGIDPYISKDLNYENGVTVRKQHFHELHETYDVILSHHSFEHVPEPLPALAAIKNSLREGGVCILTMPVAEDLYREYRENCYLIQAPQHPFLYTLRGFALACSAAGLAIENVIRDASDAATWSRYSESWRRGVAMNESEPKWTRSELQGYAAKQREMSRERVGDNVTFILKHPN